MFVCVLCMCVGGYVFSSWEFYFSFGLQFGRKFDISRVTSPHQYKYNNATDVEERVEVGGSVECCTHYNLIESWEPV